ncbi:MAG: C25 family cysteine peptidase, partial [Pirellulaceae bacterium]
DKRIATDNPYGDMNGDDSPELCVARLPADSAEEVENFFAKVINYENNTDFAAWRRDVHIVAGVGGFGALADSVIEMTTRRFLSDRIPGWSRLTMTQASTGSHYCPDPWRFSEACINRMNQGGMFWVYIGHGHVRTLDYVKAGEEYLPIFNEQHLPAIKSKHPPIAVFLACYTGAFDAVQDSLAERLTLNPNGPIASIAASRVSGPYGLATMSDGMLRYCYEQRIPTLGEVLVESKRRMLKPANPEDSSNSQMQMIESIAKALSPEDYDLMAERREHVWQMHLIGDPLISMRYPKVFELESPSRTEPGQSIKVRGVSTMRGKLTLEFGYRRAKVQRELDQVPVALDTQTGRDAFQERYQRANDRTLVRVEGQIEAGPFEQEIQLPDELSNGRYRIRAYIAGESDWQAGYREFTVRRPRKQPSEQ